MLTRLDLFVFYLTATIWLGIAWFWQVLRLPVPFLDRIVLRRGAIEPLSLEIRGVDIAPWLVGLGGFILIYLVVAFFERGTQWRASWPQRDEYGRPLRNAPSEPELILDGHWLRWYEFVLALAALGTLVANFYFDWGDPGLRFGAILALVGAVAPPFWRRGR